MRSTQPPPRQSHASLLTQGLLGVVILLLGIDLTLRLLSRHGPAEERNPPRSTVSNVDSTYASPVPVEITTVPMTSEALDPAPTPPMAVPPPVEPPSTRQFVAGTRAQSSNSLPQPVESSDQGGTRSRPFHGPMGFEPRTVAIQYFDPRAITYISVPVDDGGGGTGDAGTGDVGSAEGGADFGRFPKQPSPPPE